MDPDSAFARLTDAWHVPGSAVTRQETAPTVATPRRSLGLPGVLHASMGDEVPLPCDNAAWAFDAARPNDSADLESLLLRLAPRVLLIDVELCALLDAGELRRLRRAAPSTAWVLVWDDPSRWHALAMRSEARGGIARGCNAEELTRALRAVLRGELWFSRPMMQALYEAARRGGAPAVDELPAEAPLSPREAQTLALMRAGLTNKEIAARLDVSVSTVKKHLASVFDKRGLRSRRQDCD